MADRGCIKVKVMQDPWLSLNHSKLARSPQCHEDLMVPEERRWNVPKIKDFIISTAMTEAITSLSLYFWKIKMTW
jgi:hypothetical protein